MNALQIILACVLIIAELLLILSVLKQKGSGENIGSIMGGGNSESYLGKSKVRSKDDRWALLTKVCMGFIVVIALVLAVMFA